MKILIKIRDIPQKWKNILKALYSINNNLLSLDQDLMKRILHCIKWIEFYTGRIGVSENQYSRIFYSALFRIY